MCVCSFNASYTSVMKESDIDRRRNYVTKDRDVRIIPSSYIPTMRLFSDPLEMRSSTKWTMKSIRMWAWLFQPFACRRCNLLCIFPYIYLSINSFGNKYLLSCNGEICAATNDMMFVLLHLPERSDRKGRAK